MSEHDDPEGGSSLRRSRGRPKVAPDAEQRVRIVEIGRGVFLERGYGRASMDEVAKRARVSKKTLYRFFANKAELFGAVVADHRRSMLALPAEDDDRPVEDVLKAIVRLDIAAEEDRDRHALLEMALHESMAHPELRDLVFRHGVEASRRDLADWLARRAALGHLRVGDADGLARILMDMVFGASRPPPRLGERENLADRRARLELCLAVFLHGIAPR